MATRFDEDNCNADTLMPSIIMQNTMTTVAMMGEAPIMVIACHFCITTKKHAGRT